MQETESLSSGQRTAQKVNGLGNTIQYGLNCNSVSFIIEERHSIRLDSSM